MSMTNSRRQKEHRYEYFVYLCTQERDPLTRILSLIGNFSGMIYFPIEHIAWASDHKILSLRNGSASWWTAGIVCWNISLITGLLK